MSEHRWSGWPGAFCLRCGAEDVAEICATTHDHADLDPERGICVIPCASKQGPCVTDAGRRADAAGGGE